MSTDRQIPANHLAARIRTEREARGWSLADLGTRAGVSKAMISKVERGEVSPTAALLGRLSAAFGLSLSTLLARAEAQGGRLVRAADQPVWRDPASGLARRQISPVAETPIQMTQVSLPPGASIGYPAAAFTFLQQVVWVTEGELTFIEGEVGHALHAGDCIALGSPRDCAFRNESGAACTYVVVVIYQ
jgi:transcriptional regulator with XRE-family HTH domain